VQRLTAANKRRNAGRCSHSNFRIVLRFERLDDPSARVRRIGLLTRSSLEKIWHFHFADARVRIRIPEQERLPRPTHARKKNVSSLPAEVKYTLLCWIKLAGVVTYDASVHVTMQVYVHVWQRARKTNSVCACACACVYVCARARMSRCVNAH